MTSDMVRRMVACYVGDDKGMKRAGEILMDVVTAKEPPEFITTLLSESFIFKLVL